MPKKVSVIMPAYNCEKFIEESIGSVMAQTYPDWELIVVDDCSSDGTYAAVKRLSESDSRIVCLKNSENSGAAASRNKAVEAAGGDYLAFLDSDDRWMPDKLAKQVAFMEENGYTFTCTEYKKIDENGQDLGIIKPAYDLDYNGLLKRCPGNSTVMYDAKALGKFSIPLIRKRNDYVMWLRVIKKAGELHGLHEVLGCHRVGQASLSSNKASLVKYQWEVYRHIEKLGFFRCVYLIVWQVFKSVFKID